MEAQWNLHLQREFGKVSLHAPDGGERCVRDVSPPGVDGERTRRTWCSRRRPLGASELRERLRGIGKFRHDLPISGHQHHAELLGQGYEFAIVG